MANKADVILVDVYLGYYKYDPDKQHYVGRTVTAEVLTIHFKTGNMRVRYYGDDGKPKTFDTDAAELIEKIYSSLNV